MTLPRIGLRGRAVAGFAATAMAIAAVLATTSYSLTRDRLVDERLEAHRERTYVHARLARSSLRAPDPDVTALLNGLGGGGTDSSVVLRHQGRWFSSGLGSGPDLLPERLVRLVSEGGSGHQLVRSAEGRLQLVVGLAVPAVDASYFELFDWGDLDTSLDSLTRALVAGSGGATAMGALIGFAWASRLLRPLRPVADAAERVAGGALETRLQEGGDRDLHRLIASFNAMASSLQERIDRERRFSADVTHELRSPLAALGAAVEVIGRRRGELPGDVGDALDVLREKVDAFQETVLELLEIARIDAGSAELNLDVVDLPRLLARVNERHGHRTRVSVAEAAPVQIVGDRRRLVQVFENLVTNASRYANGLEHITITRHDDEVIIYFDDGGPGVPVAERHTIFERFNRGAAGRDLGAGSGTGLGLALVVEHLHLHGGRVWVEDAPSGGARFVVALPIRPMEAAFT